MLHTAVYNVVKPLQPKILFIVICFFFKKGAQLVVEGQEYFIVHVSNSRWISKGRKKKSIEIKVNLNSLNIPRFNKCTYQKQNNFSFMCSFFILLTNRGGLRQMIKQISGKFVIRYKLETVKNYQVTADLG